MRLFRCSTLLLLRVLARPRVASSGGAVVTALTTATPTLNSTRTTLTRVRAILYPHSFIVSNLCVGFFYSHIGWMLVKPRRRPGVADVSDLSKNPVVRFQHAHYVKLMVFMAFILPTLVAWLGWGDAPRPPALGVEARYDA